MLYRIIFFLQILVDIYGYVFFVYILLSFFYVDRNNFFIKIIVNLCEPVYGFILRFLPRLRLGMIDFSPIYVYLLIAFIRIILSRIAYLLIN